MEALDWRDHRSSALLDDSSRVYFGSGDGKLRALDASTGALIWTFQAEDPSVNKAFINWFEGNVAIGTDARCTSQRQLLCLWCIARFGEPALEVVDERPDLVVACRLLATGNLFIGNNYLAGSWLMGLFWKNLFALAPDGTLIWRDGVNASIAASPTLDPQGRMFVGAFDGYLRAYDQSDDTLLWSYGTSDHVYSSPSILSDGTIVQPSTDGTVYALNPATGTLKWHSTRAADPLVGRNRRRGSHLLRRG